MREQMCKLLRDVCLLEPAKRHRAQHSREEEGPFQVLRHLEATLFLSKARATHVTIAIAQTMETGREGRRQEAISW